MEMMVRDLWNMAPAFNTLAEMKLPVQTSYKIARINHILTPEIKLAEDKRMESARKYCKKDEDGEPVMTEKQEFLFPAETQKQFLAEMEELDKVVIEVTVDKIKLSELEGVEISPQNITRLWPILDAE